MTNSVVFALIVELVLMLLTILLFIRRNGLFGSGIGKKKAFAAWSGLFFLFLTFIWSVITGIVLAMNGLYLRV